MTDEFGCFVLDTFQVTISDFIDITFEYDPINCSELDLNTEITAGPADLLEFQWFYIYQMDTTTISTNPDHILAVNPDSSLWYYVIGTDLSGCEYFDSVFVEVPLFPEVSIQGDSINCSTDEDCVKLYVDYDQSLNFSFQWSGGIEPINQSTNDTICVDPSVTTTYFCEVIDLTNDCPYNLEYTVFVPDIIGVEITGTDLLCINDLQEITLTAEVSPDVPVSYEWTDLTNDIILPDTSSSIAVSPDSTNIYQVLVTDEFGCFVLDTFQVFVTDSFSVSVSASDTINCLSDTIGIDLIGTTDLSNPTEVYWTNNVNDEVINGFTANVNPDTITTYTFTVIDSFGCKESDSVTIFVPSVTITIDGTDTGINCLTDADSIMLTVSSNVDSTLFTWCELTDNSLDIIYIGYDTTILVNPSVTTTYIVKGEDIYGCTSIDTSVVIVPDYILDIELENTQINCISDDIPVLLEATVNTSPVTIDWYQIGDPQYPEPFANGYSVAVDPQVSTFNYYAIATDTFGCTDTAWTNVLVPEELIINIPSDIFCTDTAYVCIDANIPASSIVWEADGDILSQYEDEECATIILDSHLTTYTVTYTDTFGCFLTDTALLTNGKLDIDIFQDSIICPGEMVQLFVENYDWPTDTLTVDWVFDSSLVTVIQNDNTELTISVAMPDTTLTIQAVVTNQFNCSETLSVTVETTDFDPVPLDNYRICFAEEICLNPAYNEDYLYTWSSSNFVFADSTEANPCIELDQSTSFSVIVQTDSTEALYCVDTFEMDVVVNKEVVFELWSNLYDTPLNDGFIDTFCTPQNIDLWVTDSLELETINWYLNGNEFNTEDFYLASPQTTNTLNFEVVVGNNTIQECQDSIEVTFEIHPVIASLQDTCFCYEPGVEHLLLIQDAEDLVYIDWFDDSLSDDEVGVYISPSSDTSYQVAIANSYGCQDTLMADICVVNLYDGLELTADPDTIAQYADSEILLELDLTNKDSVDYIEWFADPNQSVLFKYDEVYENFAQSLEETTVFTAEVSNYLYENVTCRASIDVTVEVLGTECSDSNIFVPNAFSPNGDNLNDEFFVKGNVIDSMELYIVNRWGQTIFEATDINTGWDGTFLGRDLPPDVYGFSLKAYCKDDEVYELKGNINLIR